MTWWHLFASPPPAPKPEPRPGTFFVSAADALGLARATLDRFEKVPFGEYSIEIGLDASGLYFCSVVQRGRRP